MIWDIYAQLGKIVAIFESIKRSKKKRAFPGHTLYHFYVSPPSMRARNAVYELGLDLPFKEVLADSVAWNELVKGGGIDQVPCLRIEEAGKTRWMYESKDIIAYLKSHA
jgi:glutathione S-transferase